MQSDAAIAEFTLTGTNIASTLFMTPKLRQPGELEGQGIKELL